jgi:hypothetical protein
LMTDTYFIKVGLSGPKGGTKNRVIWPESRRQLGSLKMAAFSGCALGWICPAPSVPLIYIQEAVVPFMVRTRRIRERVCLR